MSVVDERPIMLVTGAARGIGAAVSRMAAARGYLVVVNAGSSIAAATALASEIDGVALAADVSDEGAVTSMFAAIDELPGRLEVLVNNAGIAGRYGLLDDVDAAMLQRLFAVNVIAPFICAREAVRRMRADGRGGAIVNISSKAAVLGGSGEWVHYAATKGALDTMTTGLSRELAADGIRVNSVRPGLIDNDFNLQAPPGRVERLRPTVPMGRAGTMEEVAEAVLWLASPAAAYTTGTFLDVTGGR
jgi:NAD(P)-dependent dehydrogenase (short-subunit alcohol dehydrogenase family)